MNYLTNTSITEETIRQILQGYDYAYVVHLQRALFQQAEYSA